jgi:hypothetical protein
MSWQQAVALALAFTGEDPLLRQEEKAFDIATFRDKVQAGPSATMSTV